MENDEFLPFPDHPDGELRLKVLHRVVWRFSKFITRNFRANSSNTLLIDWSPESSILNPWYNAIFPTKFAGDENDTFLDTSLRPYLRGLLLSGRSVPQYLSECPPPPNFGRLEPHLRSVLGLKAQKLAKLTNRRLVLDSPREIMKYSKTGKTYFV